MLDKVKNGWEYIQELLDVNGDAVMFVFTTAIVFRIVYAALGHPPMSVAESTAYGTAIAAFGYSKGGPKQS